MLLLIIVVVVVVVITVIFHVINKPGKITALFLCTITKFSLYVKSKHFWGRGVGVGG